MIGFNDSLIPKKIMDTNYITDNICSMVGLNNTRIINKKLRIDTLNFINDTCNLYITYKLKDFKSNYYPSTLISNFEVVREEVDNVSYSATFDKMRLVKMYDDFIKYGYKNNNLGLLNSNYKIKYNSYSNKFSGIDRVMDKLTLSYSKMQMYNKCAFRYYLANILKLDIYEANFSTTIGSMVHFVMEKCLANNDMNIDKYVSLYLGDTIFSKKESFFLEKYKESIKELMDQVMLEKKYSLFDKAMYEKKIDIDYGDNIHFVGVIDKILYYIDNNSTYIGLIDYKTGADDISLKYLDYGLNIQLPIYLYLSTRLDFNNVKCVGFYLQKFNIINKDYRLVGYSNSDKDILTVLDNNYDNSKIVKGLKTLKDGSFSRYSMVLSSKEMDNIRDKVEKIISDVIDKIKNNQFEINPKVTIDKDIGCEFCKFKDICFRTKDDEVLIQPHEYGGE